MTLAPLGFSVDTSEVKRGAVDLETIAKAAQKAEQAATGMSSRIEQAANKVANANNRQAAAAERARKASEGIFRADTHAARYAQAIDASTRSLSGFEAIAARASVQAERLVEQMQRMTAHDVRDMDIQAYGKELDQLRGKYNPLYREISRYRTTLGEIRQAHAVGAISAAEMAGAISRERQAALASIAVLKGRTNAVREASNAVRGFHTTNLLFQMQDVGMMAAMGQAPHILALQQGTQVAGIFHQIGNGKQIVEALKGAFIGLINPISLATVGAIGLGTAIFQYMSKGEESIDKLDGILERHKAIIDDIRTAYGDAAIAAADYANASGDELRVRLKASVEEMTVQLRASLSTLLKSGDIGYSTRSVFAPYLPVEEFELFRDQIVRLWTEGQPALQNIGSEIAKIGLENGAETQAQKLLDFLDAVIDLDARIREGAQGFDKYNASLRRLASEGLREANETLRSFAPDKRTDIEKIESAYQTAIGAATKVGQSIRAAEGIRIAADRDRAAAIDELTRKEEVRRGQYELDYRSITARTAAEKAAIAAERERLNLSGEALSEAEKARRIEEARTLSLRQSHHEASEALRKRVEAERDSIAQMELGISLIGKSAGEVARLSTEYDLLRAAMQAAYEAGTTVSDDEIDRIRRHAAEIGKLAEAYAALQALDDIRFDLSIMGLSEGDQRIMTALRRLGIEADSAYGQMVGGALRYRDVQQELQDEMKQMEEIGKDAFMSILDLLYETGDIGDKLIGIFANIGKEFAKLGMEKLWKQISGEGLSKFDGVAGGASSGASTSAQAATAQRIESSVQRMTETMAVASDDLAGNIRRAADLLGTSAHDLATVISFETGGTFRTDIRGGAGNRHIGLIQFGPEEQRRYGAAIGQTLTDQMDAVIRYLKDRGFKPGMTGAELYATINTGSPGTGHRSDAANGGTWGSANDKWNYQMGGHRANADRILGPQEMRGAVKGGLIDFSQQQQTAADTATAGNATPGGGLFGGNMKGVMAGIGAFAGGLQSGDPLGGAISGGLGMLGAGFGAVGIIGGAVLGLIGGLIGRARQKREELKKAQQELEQQMGAITELIATATGNFMGQFESSIMKTADEFSKAIALANKAKNVELVNELEEAQDEFFSRMTDRWVRGFEGMIASMESGLGLDSEFMAGMDAVEKMRESLVGFVNDTRLFADANGDLASVINDRKSRFGTKSEELYGPQAEFAPGNPDGMTIANTFVDGYLKLGVQLVEKGVGAFTRAGGQLYDTFEQLERAAKAAGYELDETGELIRIAADANADLANEVERAQRAAQATALAMISGAEEFTAMEEAVQKINGTVATMNTLLVDLGMSAEEAATAIDLHLNIATAKLRDAYRDELNASINDLSGFGFLNEIVDAQAKYHERMKDAAVLGLSGELALREFNLSLIDIVNSANLSRQEIEMLAGAFPAIGALLSEGLIGQAAATVERAKSDLRAAYEREASELERLIDATKRFIDQIKDLRHEMRLDQSISPLNPEERLAEAEKAYRDTLALAMTGDEEARAELTRVTRAYLDEAADYFASTDDYYAIWKDVDLAMSGILKTSEKSLSDNERQLQVLKDQVGALIDINDSVMSVEEAIAALADAMANFQIAVNAAAGGGSRNTIGAAYEAHLGRPAGQSEIDYWAGTGKSGSDIIKDIATSPEAQLNKMYKDIMGRNADTAGAQYWLSSGKSLAQIEADLKYAKATGSYVSGGYTGDIGINEVAGIVHGREFVMNAAATQRWRPQFEAINAGASPWMYGRPAANENGIRPEHLDRLARSFESALRVQTERLEAKFDAEIAELKGQRSDTRLAKNQPRKAA